MAWLPTPEHLQHWLAVLPDFLPSNQGKHFASLRNHIDALCYLSSNSYKTIKVYLSTIRHMHVTAGIQPAAHTSPSTNPEGNSVQPGNFPFSSTPSAHHTPTTTKHPSKQSHHYNNIPTWAACCLAFFGFLHVSEFTTLSDTQYDPLH